MYFKYFKNFNYNFGSTADTSYEMKNIFSRPVIETNAIDVLRINNDQSPDQTAQTLYDDNSLFYVNLLLNNILNKNDWAINELDFVNKLETTYSGYSFHILEAPSENLNKGDLVVLDADIFGDNCTDPNDLSCFITYALIENWDPILRKLWIRVYTFGELGAQNVTDFFAEGNKFRIYKRNADGSFNSDGVLMTNRGAFLSDPNYMADFDECACLFTMKRVEPYTESLSKFKYKIGSQEIGLNPYTINESSTNASLDDINGVTYNSANTNSTCSLLDAYILSRGGQTGPDSVPYSLNYRVSIEKETSRLDKENEDKRYIRALKKPVVGAVVEKLKRSFND